MKPTALTFLGVPGLLLAFLPVVAFAGGAEKDGGEVRTITATSATSDCIGDPRTPVCAVETLLACFARQDMALCKRVTARPVEPVGRKWDITYRILAVEIQKGTNALKAKPAATEFADVVIQNFAAGGDRYLHCLERTVAGWRILGWAIEGGDIYCQ
jgi:hypothetical protein